MPIKAYKLTPSVEDEMTKKLMTYSAIIFDMDESLNDRQQSGYSPAWIQIYLNALLHVSLIISGH